MTSVLTMTLLELTGLLPGSPPGIVPFIDGRSLIDLVAEFESSKQWSPAGDYGGLLPERFERDDVFSYYLGSHRFEWPRPEVVWLLGCSCGIVECWPLEARVTVDDDRVTWSNFAQEWEPDRDYTGFGPFVFDRAQYEAAVHAVVEEVAQNKEIWDEWVRNFVATRTAKGETETGVEDAVPAAEGIAQQDPDRLPSEG